MNYLPRIEISIMYLISRSDSEYYVETVISLIRPFEWQAGALAAICLFKVPIVSIK